ncbi:3-hydroxyacyl-ACP dehydratase FabZ [Pseudoxanthomonas indica]|uniref:3-hydroxyacyl-[acyl-carrier-protein] dehydratase FabZ n=1 Tax=Pseudoxanthomonas indica TaxID=428993 RepID=A0A1T5J8D5_9GAMM|nr:3-hydroxyacyl-ACP dehydratase FabZ [Pseudoxanthomonas indica]GGD57030.1 3-hydroxyacyl-[acyl-carrier-protein] dehydratase FabZ [Pseudoxanthomonas indica]SKC47532.1 3-hydroxyacyl-[acyl-carrier-protein] dehydratase [Pseudoxanthomonas indica]
MTETETEVKLPIDVVTIQKLLPHRYPFLLVDRIVELEPHKRVVGIKNVTINEPFFQGHFPGHPVMPGVLVVEALAQAGGVLTQLSRGLSGSDRLFYLVKVDNVRFSRMVVPGDVLELHVDIKRVIRNMTLYNCVAKVAGNEVASCEVLCAETVQ